MESIFHYIVFHVLIHETSIKIGLLCTLILGLYCDIRKMFLIFNPDLDIEDLLSHGEFQFCYIYYSALRLAIVPTLIPFLFTFDMIVISYLKIFKE